MLLTPELLTGPFGRSYLISNSYTGSTENFWGRSDSAFSILRQLNASPSYWIRLIANLGEFGSYMGSPHHCQRLVAELIASRRLSLYALPSRKELERFRAYAHFDSSSINFHFQLLPRNGHLLNRGQRWQASNLDAADKLLQRLNLSDDQLNDIAATIPHNHAHGGSARNQLCQALVDEYLVITALYGHQHNLPQGLAFEELISHQSSGSTLGPHDSPDYVAPPPRPAASAPPVPDTPAQSLQECETRLADARKRLEAHGYQPKYSDEEIRTLAQKGELDDRFIVRFTKTSYAGDTDRLGRQNPDGSTRTWVTTFNQLENADTDPETIAAVLGVDDYDPNADYTLIVVDTHAPGADQAVSIVPTFENLGKTAKSEIKTLTLRWWTRS